MESFIDKFTLWLQAHGASLEQSLWLARASSVVAMLLLAFAANWIAKHIILRTVKSIAKRTTVTWDDVLLETGVFTRLSHLAPALVIDALGPVALGHNSETLAAVETATSIYLLIIGLMVLHALLNTAQLILGRTTRGAQIPIKGFTQGIMLLATLITGIFILAALMGKSPVYFLSGIGALTAIIILIFKDAILGFVAGIQISVNQLVRVGDWIEMPKNGADGDVIDVSLTTVKVRNWDKTITTIPTYSLISDSFKNWRGMTDSGGRRIKRSLYIDMHTVAFATEQQLARWNGLRLLKPYLDEKLAAIASEKNQPGQDTGVLGNGRRLTNLGTFRAYCIAYLKAHPGIHQDMTFLVRQLQPTEHGVPLELYVFTTDIRWAFYEDVQSDIFDHLLAVIGQFDLRVFQNASGSDIEAAASALRSRPALAQGPLTDAQ
ncbi:mechanosensitive ion channel family protein [Rariglobus hedericola]|uniref:Mechanosensing system component YbdG n=1 Tax=Rariglobus hedericola TaxID=2597822 RepID=A0A556QK93_9BACT|nr:mechanosensitive ion channel domain-containing protein [Rariglobus hedericola]TSJ77073.1 mechanosensitive ion channel [Rariglobus hedericola]